MAYPDGSSLALFLVDRGVLTAVPGDVSDMDQIMLSVVAGWLKDTGWDPFQYVGSDSTRYYGLDGNLLFLTCGLLDVDTLEIDGNELTVNQDFYLLPANSEPKTRIQFTSMWSTDPRSIEILGSWGYTRDAEDHPDVIQALLRKGAAEYVRDISNNVVGTGGSLKRLKQDDVEKEYGATAGNSMYSGTLAEQWEKSYRVTVARYEAPWMVMA